MEVFEPQQVSTLPLKDTEFHIADLGDDRYVMTWVDNNNLRVAGLVHDVTTGAVVIEPVGAFETPDVQAAAVTGFTGGFLVVYQSGQAMLMRRGIFGVGGISAEDSYPIGSSIGEIKDLDVAILSYGCKQVAVSVALTGDSLLTQGAVFPAVVIE